MPTQTEWVSTQNLCSFLSCVFVSSEFMLFKSVWEVMNSARALVPLQRLRTKERVQRMYVNTSRRRHRSAREKEGKKKESHLCFSP